MDINRLSLKALTKAENVKEYLKSYEYTFTIDKAAREFAKTLHNFIEMIINEIKKMMKKPILTDEIAFQRLKTIQGFSKRIVDIYEYSMYLKGSEIIANPPALTEPIKILFDDILKKRVKFKFVRPDWKYNFTCESIVKDFLEPLCLGFLKYNFRSLHEKDIYIISYPSMEKNNFLVQSPTLVHEIAHQIEPLERTALKSIWSKEKQITNHIKNLLKIKKENLNILEIEEEVEKKDFRDTVSRWEGEYFADILSLYIIGPAYFFSLFESLLAKWGLYEYDERLTHPCPRDRILFLVNSKYIKEFLKNSSKTGANKYFKFIKKINKLVKPRRNYAFRKTKNEKELKYLKEKAKKLRSFFNINIFNKMETDAKNYVADKKFKINKIVFKLLKKIKKSLEENVPPYTETFNLISTNIKTILNGAWLYWLLIEEKLLSANNGLEQFYISARRVSDLTEYAVEIALAEFNYMNANRNSSKINKYGKNKKLNFKAGALLTKKQIKIIPILDSRQISKSSVDIRIGNKFIVTKRRLVHSLDPRKRNLPNLIQLYQEKIYIPFGYPFVLHPQEFVLSSTLEYFSFPNKFMGYVVGRSTLGRLGLIVATATKIGPGYKGVLTLELTNVGAVPMVLYPYQRIAQLVIHKAEGPWSKVEKDSKYQYSIEPQFSKVFDDDEIQEGRLWQSENNKNAD